MGCGGMKRRVAMVHVQQQHPQRKQKPAAGQGRQVPSRELLSSHAAASLAFGVGALCPVGCFTCHHGASAWGHPGQR